jgi:dUTPase
VSQGNRIAQLIILKLGDNIIEEVDELSVNEDRGDSGYGSSGE